MVYYDCWWTMTGDILLLAVDYAWWYAITGGGYDCWWTITVGILLPFPYQCYVCLFVYVCMQNHVGDSQINTY